MLFECFQALSTPHFPVVGGGLDRGLWAYGKTCCLLPCDGHVEWLELDQIALRHAEYRHFPASASSAASHSGSPITLCANWPTSLPKPLRRDGKHVGWHG